MVVKDGSSATSTARAHAPVLQASQFTLVLKYRIHMVTEWKHFTFKRLQMSSTPRLWKGMSYMPSYKTNPLDSFSSKRVAFIPALPKPGQFKTKVGHWQRSSSLCPVEGLHSLPPVDYSSQARATCGVTVRGHKARRRWCIRPATALLWQQKLPAEPCHQGPGLVPCETLDGLWAFSQDLVRKSPEMLQRTLKTLNIQAENLKETKQSKEKQPWNYS